MSAYLASIIVPPFADDLRRVAAKTARSPGSSVWVFIVWFFAWCASSFSHNS
jgi:hypothetical protein